MPIDPGKRAQKGRDRRRLPLDGEQARPRAQPRVDRRLGSTRQCRAAECQRVRRRELRPAGVVARRAVEDIFLQTERSLSLLRTLS